jgi:hypothetical protein
MNPLKSNNNSLVDFIIDWNNNYPFDYFWRKKYNVAFGSQQHLDMCFIDMRIDLLEDKIYENFVKQLSKQEDKSKEFRLLKKHKQKYVPLSGEELDDVFNNLDISKFANK